MLILAFDCCLHGCSAALMRDGTLLACDHGAPDAAPAEILVPLVGTLLARRSVAWGDISALAVTIGPGSFTGIRTGLAAARGFALASGLRVFPIGTLEAIAFSIIEPDNWGPILVVHDARRNEVFVQQFDWQAVPVAPARRCAVSEIADDVLSTHRVAGSGTVLLPIKSRDIVGPPAAEIDASHVAAAAQARADLGERPVPGTAVTPLYLRRPDARANAGRPLVAVRK